MIAELVFSFADERGMTDVEVQKKANLDRKAFSKLKCGTTKNPSKSTALALAIALELSLDDTKDLLSRAGLALSPCSKQDVIVQYFIEREAYDICFIHISNTKDSTHFVKYGNAWFSKISLPVGYGFIGNGDAFLCQFISEILLEQA